MNDLGPRRPATAGDMGHAEALRKRAEYQARVAASAAPGRLQKHPTPAEAEPLRLATPATESELRLPAPSNRGWLRTVLQLFITLLIILGLAIAIVAIYARYYQ